MRSRQSLYEMIKEWEAGVKACFHAYTGMKEEKQNEFSQIRRRACGVSRQRSLPERCAIFTGSFSLARYLLLCRYNASSGECSHGAMWVQTPSNYRSATRKPSKHLRATLVFRKGRRAASARDAPSLHGERCSRVYRWVFAT